MLHGTSKETKQVDSQVAVMTVWTSSGAEGSTYATMAGVRAAKSATACGPVTCVLLLWGSGTANVPGSLPRVRFQRGRWAFPASTCAPSRREDTDAAAVRPLFKLVRWPRGRCTRCEHHVASLPSQEPELKALEEVDSTGDVAGRGCILHSTHSRQGSENRP
ncbi:hypothetical protein HPB48_002906 [Haemaphysalis longicornis]|uniref:Uncharacterized protein n=1 Tax=Haemaphysalis longicornis TaxID=44386 RepID=A0A9J6FG81_HAELO|nr:hypothetical protein HPB48_002906 [Haemaphysalis longicornis]